jgi:murein L,D-transpeptidase YafK
VFAIVATILITGIASGSEKADLVRVVKSERRLYLMKNGEILDDFHVAFGGNPKGHKERRGDQRTPEGRYVLDWKNDKSKYHLSIHVSYPNAADRAHARKLGVDPGGDIMVHGQPNGKEAFTWITQRFNWTDGCIALSNKNMDKVWAAVDPGTPIVIEP